MSVSAPLAAIRAQHPLLHCISNIVSANDCANLALAIGASPIMAQASALISHCALLQHLSLKKLIRLLAFIVTTILVSHALGKTNLASSIAIFSAFDLAELPLIPDFSSSAEYFSKSLSEILL